MTTTERHRYNRQRYDVRVVDHGAHRRVNRYEVILCDRHDGSCSACGWYDERPQAQGHAVVLRARLFGETATVDYLGRVWWRRP